jgi:hypothetical protein
VIIYNFLPVFSADQFLAMLGLEILYLILTLTFYKKQISLRLLFFSVLLAAVLALLSSLIGTGFYGGMMYHERFGWPFPFLTVSRNIEAGSLAGMPFASQVNWLKFFATIAFWGVFPLSFLLNLKADKRYNRFTAIFLSIFLVLVLIFCLNDAGNLQESKETSNSEAIVPSAIMPDPKTVQIMRKMIEQGYPEFADFENQPSFAGQSVKIVLEDGDYYFAYLTHGSGIPIIKATCFRVDGQASYKIGEFPNPLDTYLGYPDVDPQTCKGIR